MADELVETGPIDYLVVEFPGNRMTGEGMPILLDLVERGIIRILDFRFVLKHADGSIAAAKMSDLDADGEFDVSIFEGAASGLLDDEDLVKLAAVVDPNSTAAMLVYENVWAAPLAAALRRGGAQMVATGRIPIEDLIAVLDEQDALSTS